MCLQQCSVWEMPQPTSWRHLWPLECIYLLCLSVSGSGPMMSHDIFSKGQLACMVPSGAWACGWGDYAADIGHSSAPMFGSPARTPASTISFTFSVILKIPKWPAWSCSCFRTVCFMLFGMTTCVWLAVVVVSQSYQHKTWPFRNDFCNPMAAQLACPLPVAKP